MKKMNNNQIIKKNPNTNVLLQIYRNRGFTFLLKTTTKKK